MGDVYQASDSNLAAMWQSRFFPKHLGAIRSLLRFSSAKPECSLSRTALQNATLLIAHCPRFLIQHHRDSCLSAERATRNHSAFANESESGPLNKTWMSHNVWFMLVRSGAPPGWTLPLVSLCFDGPQSLQCSDGLKRYDCESQSEKNNQENQRRPQKSGNPFEHPYMLLRVVSS